MTKTLNKTPSALCWEGMYLRIIKAIDDKATADIILSGEMLSFSSKIRNK